MPLGFADVAPDFRRIHELGTQAISVVRTREQMCCAYGTKTVSYWYKSNDIASKLARV